MTNAHSSRMVELKDSSNCRPAPASLPASVYHAD